MTIAKWTIRKYMGDDACSWALFQNGVVVMTGMDRREARYRRDRAIRTGKPA